GPLNMAATAGGNSSQRCFNLRKPKRNTSSSTSGAQSSAVSQGILLRSRRWVAPPMPAAMTAIGPRNSKFTAHMSVAHCSIRLRLSAGNQSRKNPSPLPWQGSRGVSEGARIKARKSRSSARNLMGLATVPLVQAVHGLLKFTLQQLRQNCPAAVDAVLYSFHVLATGWIQHKS